VTREQLMMDQVFSVGPAHCQEVKCILQVTSNEKLFWSLLWNFCDPLCARIQQLQICSFKFLLTKSYLQFLKRLL